MSFKVFLEKVSQDCSDGRGIIPDGPYKGWKVLRTNHLDDYRGNKQRDHNFECNDFEKIVLKFLEKRPLGIEDGEYSITWKNQDGYQNAVVSVNNKFQVITFVTIIQMNKKTPKYTLKSNTRKVYIGIVNAP